MEAIRVVIADDEQISRKLLIDLLKGIPPFICVGEAENGEKLISLVREEEPDLVLVDVSMPKVNGFDAVKECLKFMPNLKVIFITAHDEYALEAFKVSAVDYLVKPLDHYRLINSLEKAKQTILLRHWQEKAKQESSIKLHQRTKKLLCRYEGTIYYIAFKDIIFIEKQGRKAIIHTFKKKIETNETMSALIQRLDSRFIQSHRSYIINIDHVCEMNSIGDSHLASFDHYSEKAYISKSNFQRVLSTVGGADYD